MVVNVYSRFKMQQRNNSDYDYEQHKSTKTVYWKQLGQWLFSKNKHFLMLFKTSTALL